MQLPAWCVPACPSALDKRRSIFRSHYKNPSASRNLRGSLGQAGSALRLAAAGIFCLIALLSGAGSAAPRPNPVGVSAQQAGVTTAWHLLRYSWHGDHCLFVPPPQDPSNKWLFASECTHLATALEQRSYPVFFGVSILMRDVAKDRASLSFEDPTLVAPLSKVTFTAGDYNLWCGETKFPLLEVEQVSPGVTSMLLQRARFMLTKEPTSYLLQMRATSIYFLVELDEPPNRSEIGPGRVYGPIKENSTSRMPPPLDPKPISNLVPTSIIDQILFEDPKTGAKLKLDWADPTRPPTGGYFRKGGKSVEQPLVFIKPSDKSLQLLTDTFSRRQGMPCAYPSTGQSPLHIVPHRSLHGLPGQFRAGRLDPALHR